VSAFVDERRSDFAVELICRTLDVSASAYFERHGAQRSQRAIDDERLLERIREVHAANYHAYGYRRTWKALRRAGEQVGRGRVQRLMRREGIQGAKRRGKPWRTTAPDAGPDEAVERAATLTNFDLKEGEGPDEVIDFFRRASDAFRALDLGGDVRHSERDASPPTEARCGRLPPAGSCSHL